MIEEGNESIYQSICTQITKEFGLISAKMNETETDLIENGREDLGQMIRKLQNHEKEKLRLTVSSQLLRKKVHTLMEEEEESDPVADRQVIRSYDH